ncbi:hypothetical protein SESBI_28400 [Sesbania bispinosa]|nr:hypothetical protein SESBI_28400 [Sesbania bispinosa]
MKGTWPCKPEQGSNLHSEQQARQSAVRIACLPAQQNCQCSVAAERDLSPIWRDISPTSKHNSMDICKERKCYR